MPPDLSVVVPAYREAGNLRELVERIHGSLLAAGIDGEVIVVDDASDDGTEELCAGLAASFPVRLLVRRGERGLATAVLHGMRHAAGRVLACMDADLSHPPERVPDLFRAVDAGDCDIAIGSRYVAGARVDEGWGLLRRVNSRVATSLARGLTAVRDPMGGFFAIRGDLIDGAPPLAPLGYKILLELLARRPHARAKEIPIDFRDRKVGESKLGLGQQVLYLRHLARLYRSRRPALSALALDLAVFALLHRVLLAHHLVSRALSLAAGAAWGRGAAPGRRAGLRLLLDAAIFPLLAAIVPGEIALAASFAAARLLVRDPPAAATGGPTPEPRSKSALRR